MTAAYRKFFRPSDPAPRIRHFANVTDHALLRWMERVQNFDVTGYREEMCRHLHVKTVNDSDLVTYLRSWKNIQTEDYRRRILRLCKDAAMMGAYRLKTSEGTFVLMAGSVVTVIA